MKTVGSESPLLFAACRLGVRWCDFCAVWFQALTCVAVVRQPLYGIVNLLTFYEYFRHKRAEED